MITASEKRKIVPRYTTVLSDGSQRGDRIDEPGAAPAPSRAESDLVFHRMLSKNRRMHSIFKLITQVAESNTTVLIEGETGTGKELVAQAIHNVAARCSGPFIAVNCAGMPETLLESELFGHEKGAFTNAIHQRKGRFELAHGGTLFLDEVGDVPAAMQAKLLRVLQERCFERVGGAETINVDVRVVAATNRSLQQLVKDGKLREDLYYRLNVVKIDLPPLRERPEDIALLAAHFISKYANPGKQAKAISPRAMELLMSHSWPGNIRELENAIERACVTSRGDTIEVDNLPPDLTVPARERSRFVVDLRRSLSEHIGDAVAQIERDYLWKALAETRGHICQCAQLCGLSRRSVAIKMAEYQLDKSYFKRPR